VTAPEAQAFSNWFLQFILAGGGQWESGGSGGSDGSDGFARDGGPGGESLTGGRCSFGHRLREGWVCALASDPLLARWFAHAYAGVDPGAS
jgi:hypothetical protein